MGNRYIRRKISHPVRFWHWKDVCMVAKAPGENTGPRAWRAHHKNWFVNLFVHFKVLWERDCHSPFAMASIHRWSFVASRSCCRPFVSQEITQRCQKKADSGSRL